MQKVTLGKSDVKVCPLTFGAWAIGGWMWGGADHKDALDAIHTSIEQGITTIDTAPVYGFGRSEEIVGEAIKGKRSSVEILTKYGMRWDAKKGEFHFETRDNDGKRVPIYKYAARDSIIKECENSLKRLGTDYIDLYQIHWPDSTTPVDETMEAVQMLIDQGKVRAAGVCNYDAKLAQEAADSLLLASVQVPYSMVRRDIEQELIPWCLENQVSILAYSPLQRGLLTGKFKPGHKFGPGDTRPFSHYFSDESMNAVNDFLESLRPLADEKKATLSQLVIRWTLSQPGITVTLVGARNPKQVLENAGALQVTLSAGELDMITRKVEQLNQTVNRK